MQTIGIFLRTLRESRQLTQEDVYSKTGITDSVLSRIENDITQEPSPRVLKKLAELYDVSNISLQIMAGYIDDEDLAQYQRVFRGVEFLTEEEIVCLKKLVETMAKSREKRQDKNGF